MPTIAFRVLGPLEVERHGEPVPVSGRRQRALLLRLVVAGGQAVPTDRLIDDLWAGEPPPSAVGTLQTYISLLRRALGDREQALLARDAVGYRLVLPVGAVDADRFESLLAESRRAPTAGDALAALDQALALWRGPALADVADEAFARAEAVRLEELRLVAAEERFAHLLALGRHDEAVPALEVAVAEHRLRERRTALLALALYRSGRQADALRAIEATRRHLADELGLEPTPDLVQLERAILTHDPSLEAPAAPHPRARPDRRPAGADRPAPGPGAAAPPPVVPLPATIPARRSTFVGRTHELAWLHEQWRAAAAGAKRLGVLDGEPGIGKTRLAARLAEQVHGEGAMVLWGRSSPEQLAPYQPVNEALREGLKALQAASVRIVLGAHEGLRLLLPDLFGDDEAPRDPASERFRLFEAATSLVTAQSRLRPVLLVIDDVHWVDAATAALVTHVLRHPDPGALLVLGTARTVDAGDQRSFLDLVADLRRDHLVDRLAVTGLDADAAALLALDAGGEEAGQRAAELHRASAGNPFYLEELAAHLAEVGPDRLGVPASVREVVDRRLERLGHDAVEVLGAAAVLGDEVDLDVLEVVTGRGGTVLDVLDVAASAGLMQESAEALGRYGFVHALVRQTLLEHLSRTRRARLHLVAADALERASTRREPRLGEVAVHRLAALPAGDPVAAVAAAVRAGRAALGALAYEDAVVLGRRAAEAVVASGMDAPDLAAEVALLQGEAARTVGRLEVARRHLDDAVAIAGTHDIPDVLGRAGLAAAAAKTAGIGFEFGVVDEELAGVLEEALVAETDTGRRIRLLAALAVTVYYDPDTGRREALSAEAVQLAEGTDDDRLVATALLARATALWTATGMPERAATLARAVLLADRAGDQDLAVRARVALVNSLLELGRIAEAEAEITRLEELAERMRQPGYRFFPASYRTLLALLRGEYAAARQGTEEVNALTADLYGVNAGLVYESRRFVLALDRLGPASVVARFRGQGQVTPLPSAQLIVALGLILGGDPDAEQRYDEVMDLPLPDDALWLAAVGVQCQLALVMGDAARAEELTARLRPFAGRLICTGTAVALGGVSRYLGLACHAAGRLDEAVSWLERAIDEHERWSARPWSARARADLADVLRHRGAPGDAARADELTALALAEAARIGLHDPFSTPRR